MQYILPVITGVFCMISAYIYFRDLSENLEVENVTETTKIPKNAYVYSILMIGITVLAAILYRKIPESNIEIISWIKRFALLSIMWPLAYIDYKTYRIPNAFILFGLAIRITIVPFELLFISEFFLWNLISELIAAGAMVLASVLCMLCIKNSIGFGDIKLFIIMGLLLGLDLIWSAVFLSLVISFVISVYLLISRKKTRKDAIPFGPALVLGVYLAVCL